MSFDISWPEHNPIEIERKASPAVAQVASEIYRLDPSGEVFAAVLRDTLDQLYDGQRTGRWNFDQLFKTEKTHMGTLVEINLQREFRFPDGIVTDYHIAGIDVDCKYSMRMGGWELPPEVIGHVALLVHADDRTASWQAGLAQIEEQFLNQGKNRDSKKTLSKYGRSRIHWLWGGHRSMAPNLFIDLDPELRSRIFAAKAKRGTHHGQARVNELFRLVQGRVIRRAELATVAQQDDPMKRARDNQGARGDLRREGILVLGHKKTHSAIARGLGLPVPRIGEFVSVRIAPASPDQEDLTVEINGSTWRRARPEDPEITAPDLPK
ncbi:NaeI family type II restriction endonuclease [Nocardia sp. alder85J]|uniref:NaeI family type II restriction endonuclease n=1 Tax=Nocardia sp. alder85J TaxID=2862949 RepID=UPI001CD3830E|nr:NaeI family type II restriction endonuclease [Nocardia sp. alder85J]MCX4093956.1 NaeI family type II restriction endonuclease [Nocardia sp. alder85J]